MQRGAGRRAIPSSTAQPWLETAIPSASLAVSSGMPDERIVTFPWGVDLRHFSPPDHVNGRETDYPDAARRPFTLLSTRGWEPIYGVEVIARAFVQAARQHPELHLVMLGNGSQAPAAAPDLSAGGCRGARPLPRAGQPGRPAALLPLRRSLPERIAFRRHVDLAAGGTGMRATGARLGHPRQPRVDHTGGEGLAFPRWRCGCPGSGDRASRQRALGAWSRWERRRGAWQNSAPIGKRISRNCSELTSWRCQNRLRKFSE